MKEVLANGYGKKFIRDIKEDYYYTFIKNGVAVLAKKDNNYILISQYRLPIDMRTLEVICGAIESGELPEEAAVREVKEEIGYNIKSLTSLGTYFCSPGNSTEKVYLFFADLGDFIGRDIQNDELDIELIFVDEDELINKINNNKFEHPFIPLAYFLYKNLI